MRWAMLAMMVAAAPAVAQEKGFRTQGDLLSVDAAGITMPARLGALTLVRTAEFTRKGDGLDNVAQYETPDKQLFVSAYVYMPPIADAAIAAYATDRAIKQRFGPAVVLAEQSVVATAGRPGTVIRSIYTGAIGPAGANGAGELLSGRQLITTAAFATLGRWTVKLRASGPVERQTEVIAALDMLIAGIKVAKPDQLATTRPLTFTAPCPDGGTVKAKLLKTPAFDPDMLLGTLLGGVVQSITPPGQAAAAVFPDQGLTPVCVRGTVEIGRENVDLIQPAGSANPDALMTVISDSGKVMAITRSPLDKAYAIQVHSVGETMALGRLDRQPGTAQLQDWLRDGKAAALTIRSTTIIDTDGKRSLRMPDGMTMSVSTKPDTKDKSN